MDSLSVWNELSYLDGILFTVWLGILYYGKCWIDSKFKQETMMILQILFCLLIILYWFSEGVTEGWTWSTKARKDYK